MAAADVVLVGSRRPREHDELVEMGQADHAALLASFRSPVEAGSSEIRRAFFTGRNRGKRQGIRARDVKNCKRKQK
jgi:hypothetical protein